MNYYSTRTKQVASASQAILESFDDEGGLYIPESFERINIKDLQKATYQEIAYIILSKFFSEFSKEELSFAVKEAYSSKNFSDDKITKVINKDNVSYLELYHGNTYAFKDLALAIYPYLVKLALKKEGVKNDAFILTATSGDTGKAALEAVKDVEGIKIAVIYPNNGVSEVQKEQMNKQQGNNVDVVSIDGNFDDAQTYVKSAFNDKGIVQQFDALGYKLISANSINIARLLPQVVYYFDAYVKLVDGNVINLNDKINISVPTGNFGNILAGYIAKQMGLPIDKIICASNSNDVLTDFFSTGVYDLRTRKLKQTVAPSMDILISSNLERYLAFILGCTRTNELMKQLSKEKCFTLTDDELKQINRDVQVGCLDDDSIREVIKKEYNNGYLLDPHSSIAKSVSDSFKSDNHTLIISTASPFKFAATVNQALGLNNESFDSLANYTNISIPDNIIKLSKQETRFSNVLKLEDLTSYLLRRLNSTKQKSFKVRVPATTANIGSGFDCIGIALSMYNTFTFSFEKGFNISGVAQKYNNKHNLVYKTYASILEKYNKKVSEDFNLNIEADVPISRGLGSSSTCIIAGIIAANIFGQLNLSLEDIIFEACLIEGHPDNVVPALIGKMSSAVLDDKKVYYHKIDVADNLEFYAAIGVEELQTKKAREALPKSLTYQQAIYNISRASILLNAFNHGILDQIAIATQDQLHQSYRLELISNLKELDSLMNDENFITSWVSGAGTTVMFLAEKRLDKQVENLISKNNINIEKLDVDNEGTKVFYL